MTSVNTAVNEFISDRLTGGWWTEETRTANEPRLRAFAQWAPRAQQLDEVKPPLIAQYRAHLLAQQWRGKPLAPVTVNKHLIVVGSLFTWGTALGYCTANPTTSIRVKADDEDAIDKRLPIPQEHIAAVAELGLLPKIMAYTGARNTEVIQLRAMDVHEIDGVLCLDLKIRDALQRRKSKAARRFIPVHPNLRPDLLARIERADPMDRLSTDPRLDAGVFRSFNNGIKRICGGKHTLYGLRHAWVVAMKSVKSDREHMMYLLGHSPKALMDSTYGTPPTMPELAETIAALPYSGDTTELALVG